MNISANFEFLPLFSAFLWLILLSLIFGLIRSKNKDKKHYSYFLSAFYAKILGALVYSLIYLIYYEGGDTLAYWDGAVNLHNLLFEAPLKFINEILTPSAESNPWFNFNSNTGFPPGWIYRESESFFVSKLTAFLSLITFKSYIASSLIVASFLSLASWYLYCTIRLLKLHNEKTLAICILFTPTVLFWCTGISKDSFVLIALLVLVSCLIRIFVLGISLKKVIVLLLVSLFLIFSMRNYVLIALVPSLFLAYTSRISKLNSDSIFKKRILKLSLYLISILVLLVYFRVSSGGGGLQSIFDEILVIQQDFANNTLYGDKKYDLFLSDYTVTSVIISIPNALIAAFYRPFPWEAVSPLLVFNGIENTILIYLTFRFFFKNAKQKIRQVRKEEILIFSFVFIIIMGFSIGFTAGLFGVLVRFKSIILPFMLILLTIEYTDPDRALTKNKQKDIKYTTE